MPEQLLSEFQQLLSVFGELSTQLQSVANLLILLIPVGIVGAWRWGVWLLRKLLGWRYKPIVPKGYITTTSIVTPVYNEDPKLFREALESWANNTYSPDQIVAVIDYSDAPCIEEFRRFADAYMGVIETEMIVTEKPGKRAALVDGIRVATSEIVFLVDSDTLWDEDVLLKAVAPFEDPKVGGVTTRQNVLGPKSITERLFDAHLDVRYLDEMRFLAATGDAVTCLSGRTAVYRRAAIAPLLEELLNETFLGKAVIAGDDKRLTHLLQAEGWKVRYQENARVYTPGFSEMRSFLRQRLRWSRNSWRADLRSLFSGWLWKNPALAFHLVDRLFQPLTTLVAPTYFVLALFYQQWFTAIILFIWWCFSRGVKLWMHLRRRGSNFVVLPTYIVFSYWFAIVKIYAFFTMNYQGWITRWDQSRMQRTRTLRMLPGYLATGVTAILMVVLINFFYNRQLLLASVLDPHVYSSESDLPNYNFQAVSELPVPAEPPLDSVGSSSVGKGITTYEIGSGDTLPLIARKYGVDNSAINVASGQWKVGEQIEIQLPFKNYEAYRNGLFQPTTSVSNARIVYKPEIDSIIVSGAMAIVDIPTIHQTLGDSSLLDYEGDGIYLLKTNLEIKRHTILLVEAPDVSWLKLRSDETGIIRIFGDSGNIAFNGVRVSSWDSTADDYDRNYEDGRSLIRVNNSRMDVINSEMSYLGQPKLRGSGGGVYGLAWRIENSSQFGKELTTGYVENNHIHDNYFGFYSFGATGMVLRNNEVYNNIEYGFDPHDDSNNFIMEDNYVHDNGNHGIIFSRRCVNNIIRRNTSVNNKLHGIMLDRESDFNSIYENTVTGNHDGIALWRSNNNEIYRNEVSGNKRGIRLNERSADNVFYHNTIGNTLQYGAYLYGSSRNNWFWQNELTDNKTGFYLRASNNFIFDNQIANSERGIYLMTESKENHISQNGLAGNDIGIYLKTAPDDFIANNKFLSQPSNSQNIRAMEEWAPVQ